MPLLRFYLTLLPLPPPLLLLILLVLVLALVLVLVLVLLLQVNDEMQEEAWFSRLPGMLRTIVSGKCILRSHMILRAVCHMILRAVCHMILRAVCHMILRAVCYMTLKAVCHMDMQEGCRFTPPPLIQLLHPPLPNFGPPLDNKHHTLKNHCTECMSIQDASNRFTSAHWSFIPLMLT